MKHIFPILLFSLPLPAFAGNGAIPAAINKQAVEAHVAFLASDALEGRQAGKRGGRIAAEYIKAVLQASGIKPLHNDYLQPFEAYAAPEKRGLEPPADYHVHPDSIAKYKRQPFHHRLKLQNVAGYIEGEKTDEYIVVGAHYDHVGIDETLAGDQIFNGADDNASSVAAVLQIAQAFAASGQKPLRSIIFTFWDGEEVNYLGSEYFVENFHPLAAIKAYINLDMIGREGLMPVVYPEFAIPQPTKENTAAGKQYHLLYTQELSAATNQLLLDLKANDPSAEPKPGILGHPSRGSDFFPFSQHNIPFQWFFTGLHPDYHTPADEIERLDLDKVTAITRAVYISLRQLAGCNERNQSYYPPIDFHSLKNSGTLTLIENFKTYQQTTDVTCGPSCILMTLDHFGKLGNHSETSLKALRGTPQDTTYLRHLLNITDSIGGFKRLSTFDVKKEKINHELLLGFLKKNIPVIIGTNEWGGHWQIITGYDTMGTETTADDVLVLADPYDRTDHNEDGYIIYPFENLYHGNWHNHYDPDFRWGLFLAIWPEDH
ncbi:MAG: M20/M25/M40 family metallo-hydrolase [Mediterranea sp.]|jgi:hypothetical protein|nr:M20/M25/M40 family metallo-hydrolase [Mediterranea sp.]